MKKRTRHNGKEAAEMGRNFTAIEGCKPYKRLEVK